MWIHSQLYLDNRFRLRYADLASYTEHIEAIVEQEMRLMIGKIMADDIRLILITHGHVDHFGSAAELRERTAAPVAVHVSDAEVVR